jgi:hypothetical protein
MKEIASSSSDQFGGENCKTVLGTDAHNRLKQLNDNICSLLAYYVV